MKDSYNSLIFKNIHEYKEYYLILYNAIYKIIIGKLKNKIFIKSKSYINILDEKDLSFLMIIEFNSIYKAYEYLENIFENNKVSIENIILNKQMQLLVNTNNETNIETNIKLTLKYNKEINEKDNIIINEIQTLKNEITNLKISNDLLKKEIINLKKYHENNNRVKEITLHSNVVDDSYAWVNLDNAFTVFKSINSILYLIY